MATIEPLERIQNKKEKKAFLRRYNRYKKYVLKLYPNSYLVMNSECKFYVVDSNGRRVLRDEYRIPDCATVYDTWKNTYSLLWSENLIDRNSRKFNDERILNFSDNKH